MFFSGIKLLCLCCRLRLPLLRKTTEAAMRAVTCSRLSRCGTSSCLREHLAACGKPSTDHGRCVWSTVGSAQEQRFISRAFSSMAWHGAGLCGCGEVGASIVAVGPVPSTEPPAPVRRSPLMGLKKPGVCAHTGTLQGCRCFCGEARCLPAPL